MKSTSLFIILLFTNINAFSQQAPCKKSFPSKDGGGCEKRYSEDSNGEIHGLYIEYDKTGKVYQRGNYVHGKKNGNWFLSVAAFRDFIGQYSQIAALLSANDQYIWYDNDKFITYDDNPIKSKEHAIALQKAAAARSAEAEKEEKRKEDKEKLAQKEKDVEIQKNIETSREKAISNEFYNSYTREDFERFVSSYPTHELVPQAKEKIKEFIRSEYASIMYLSNSSNVNETKELINKGEAFLKDTRNDIVLDVRGNRQKLIDAIEAAKANYSGELDLKFNPNSFIPFANTDVAVFEYSDKVIKVNQTEKRVKKIILKIAINLGEERNTEDAKIQRKAMFIVVCNRGFRIKQLLVQKLQSNPATKDIQIIYYPFIQGKSTNQNIQESISKDFCKTISENEVSEVKEAFDKNFKEMVIEKGISIGNDGECVMQDYLENIPLKRILLYNLKQYAIDNRNYPDHKGPKSEEAAIPLELYNEQYAINKKEVKTFLSIAKELIGSDELLNNYCLKAK